MTGEDQAGRSADDWSQQLRRQAARLEEQARRVEQGARGERLTARVLNPRSGDGWYVLHDLGVPGSPANIDHVVVTPAGVFVVDSKDWTGRVSDGKGTIWVGKYPKRRELETLAWEVAKVTTAVAGALPSTPISVRAVISLTHSKPSRPVLHAGDISAVGVGDLLKHLAAHPAGLHPDQVTSIAKTLDARLPSNTGASSSLVQPGTLSPMSPGAGNAFLRRPEPFRETPRRPPTRRPPTRPTSKSPTSLPKQLTGRVIPIAAGLVAILILPSLLRHIHATLPVIHPSTVPSTLTSPTTAAPAALQVAWTCPGAAQGWSASFSWPPGQAPSGTNAIETAPSEAGPWKIKTDSQGPGSTKLTGLTAGAHEWVRAGSLVSLSISGTALIKGQITAPPGC
jgi:hypothetical protein